MPYTVRPLEKDELPLCVSFGEACYAELGLAGFDGEVFVKMWEKILEHSPAAVLSLWDDDRPVGGIGAMLVPDVFSGQWTAVAAFIFITKDARKGSAALMLLRRFESWADLHSASQYRVAHVVKPGEESASMRTGAWYQRRGYRPLEIVYTKPACARLENVL